MHGDRKTSRVALAKVVALQNLRQRVARAEPDHVLEAQGAQPVAVEADLRLIRIQDFEDLLFVGFGILVDLLASEWRTRDVPAGGIADQAGHVADEKDDGMAQVLEVL